MNAMNDVLTLILGGGRGTRLFPLTHMRSKPAVPLGGKYRLIDIPISNCLHAGLKRIFVLTQFNSASLNRHIAQTYRLDVFSDGFVEVLAAEQTPESSDWFQGTADAVRQAARHFAGYDADYYLILAGDHLYRMDFCELIESHIESARRHHHRGAAGDAGRRDARWASSGSTIDGQIVALRGEAERARGSAEIGSSIPRGSTAGGTTADKPFVASMGIYVFSREVLLEILEQPGIDFGKEIIPKALGRYRVQPVPLPRLLGRRRHDRRVLRRQHPADAARRAVQLLPPALADLHAPALPAGDARCTTAAIDASIVAEGCYLDQLRRSANRSSASARTCAPGAKITRSVLLGADFYEEETARDAHPARHRPRRRARPRDRRQERAHRRRRAAGERRRRRSTPTATATTSATASSSSRRARARRSGALGLTIAALATCARRAPSTVVTITRLCPRCPSRRWSLELSARPASAQL